MTIRSLSLAATTVLSISLPAQAQGIGEGFEVVSYEVGLRPDLATASLSARQVMVITVTNDAVDRLVFSPNALRIADVRADGVPAAMTSGDAGLAFTLPEPLARGAQVTLSFTMSGTPARGVTVLPGGIYTGYFACDWMVCLQDAPGDKADFALDLYLPEGTTSLGIGQLAGVEPAGVALERHRWISDAPTSPYLFAFAAGDFPTATETTPAGALRYLDGTGSGADLAALFAETPAMVAFFAERAGLPLPPSGYAQLLVPGGEAQEAMGFSLVGHDHLLAEAEDPAEGWVIAHELAHQWWGNAVTTQDWQHFWLNEGITTFMVAAWKQHRFGEEAWQAEVTRLEERRARLQDLGWDMPLAWAGRYPSLGHRRAVQYSKGALFMVHLRELLGEEAFWNGLRAYTRAHAGGTVASRDLQQAMEEASGQDLSALFVEWVYGTGDETGPAPAAN